MKKRPKSRIQQKQRQRTKLTTRTIVFSSICFFAALSLFLVIGNFGTSKQAMAGLSMHGAKTVSTSNAILNEYTNLTANAAAGATTLTVGTSTLNANSRFSGNLANGELIMIIQMQGATIDVSNTSSYGNITAYNNCGNYEFIEVTGTSGGSTINLKTALAKNYTSSGKVQVIRVPRYSSFTINNSASVTSPAWNGTTGGIVAIECNGTTTINGSIDVSGKGFRGGVIEQSSNIPGNASTYRSSSASDGGEKGEGIAGFQADYTNGRYGRGAPANGGGGGNSHNASGGGGANAGVVASWTGKGNPQTPNLSWTTAWELESLGFSLSSSSGGGRGGYSYSENIANPLLRLPGHTDWGGDNRKNCGGFGGRPLDYSTNKLFMGGGGGSGDSNDGTGQGGANGGGMVYLLSGGNVSGTGSITANGSNGTTTTAPEGWDGTGGGGGGGTIIIYSSAATISNLTLSANGGVGGNQSILYREGEGAGGGGGGGYISTSNATSLSRAVNGALQGVTNSPTMTTFTANGGTKGGAGTITTGPPKPYTTPTALPIELKSFSLKKDDGNVKLEWVTSSEINNDFFTIEKSTDGINFEALTQVNGSGTTSAEHHYSFEDPQPNPGHNYYRLQQTDFDGQSETFNVLHCNVNSDNESKFNITAVGPNPFKDELRIEYYTLKEGDVAFKIFNLSGQIVVQTNQFANEGINSLNWNSLSMLKPAQYLLILEQGDTKSAAKKVIRQN